MARPFEIMAQVLLLALFAGFVGYLSWYPRYRSLPPDRALITLSLNHAGARAAICRHLSPEEISALAPNMRRTEDCPRGRVPVYVELRVDARTVYAHSAPPSGLWKDGESYVYRKFTVPAGQHHVDVRMRDTARAEGFDHRQDMDVNLVSGSILVVDFDPTAGKFIFH